MSLIGKLLGRRSAAEERQRADELFERGEFGLAKLAYERALGQVEAAEPQEARQALRERVDASRDGLARARIAEAERLASEGAPELARGELEAAAEIAASKELVAEAERRIESAERGEAREHATTVEQGEDERFETIAGSWEDAQYEEYTAHGDELRAALLALYDGKGGEARPVLERLVEREPEAHYLWFELGRARLLDNQVEGGRDALQRFVKRFEAGEGGEARLLAHMELAGLHQERGDLDAATAEYEAAVEAMPEDPRPYLAMATFFRRQSLATEAIDVLGPALEALEADGQRQWRMTLELGLAYADLGQDAQAVSHLEEVVTYLTGRQHMDLPPECSVPLARLHEKAGNKARALDLYNLLAAGSDVTNHFTYYREAARLMAELGHKADARRMLQRAAEVAPDDPEARAALDRQRAALT
jgi:tetratricopeptide (TPR) repeat protein